jgi:hypothetical protein
MTGENTMMRGRPRTQTPSPGIIINGQHITWAFIRKVYNMLGKSWDDTADAFFKARNCTGENGIYRYINAGFRSNKTGIKYITLPSKEREAGKMESIRDWWIQLYQPKHDSTVSAEHAEVKTMLDSLLQKMKM